MPHAPRMAGDPFGLRSCCRCEDGIVVGIRSDWLDAIPEGTLLAKRKAGRIPEVEVL